VQAAQLDGTNQRDRPGILKCVPSSYPEPVERTVTAHEAYVRTLGISSEPERIDESAIDTG
jgi:hypothetical protein